MKTEEVLKQLGEIGAQCAAMREALEEIVRTEPDEKPDGTVLGYLIHDAYEMCEIAKAALECDAGCALLDRLRKLEKVAEAARKLVAEVRAPNYGVEREGSSIAFWELLEVLEEALAALEEANDEPRDLKAN